MDRHSPDRLEKMRQQFETAPYPRVPLDRSPKNDVGDLFIHNLVTSYYLKNQTIPETTGKVILDAGCGSGYKSLILAEANPGARIVGIDISEESVKLARQRLWHHGFDNAEFHAIAIEALATLNLQFDYINADEVLYLLPNVDLGLQILKSVLKPDGILRGNLHSSLQRVHYFRAQKVFRLLGLTGEAPQDLEIQLVRDTMDALKDEVWLKNTTWKPHFAERDEGILANYLLQGDQGFSIPEMFSLLRTAQLELVSMVQWPQWQLANLFNDPDNLPIFLGLTLPDLSLEDSLHLFELIAPFHRLLDFWCAHPCQNTAPIPIEEWQQADWQQAQACLHPQLQTPAFHTKLLAAIEKKERFEIGQHFPLVGGPLAIDRDAAAMLRPLLDGTALVSSLVEEYQQWRSDIATSQNDEERQSALEIVVSVLTVLAHYGYVLLERL